MAKLSFISASVVPRMIVENREISVTYVTFEYGFYAGPDVDNDEIRVILPHAGWADIYVTYNGRVIDLQDEYDPIINKAVKKALKMFPNIGR